MARSGKAGGKKSVAKTRKARRTKGGNPKSQAQKAQTVGPQQLIAELRRELGRARGELATRDNAYSERIGYQAAANDVLKLMSASPGDPQPVFDLISARARDLCDAYGVTVYEFDGSLLHWRAATGVSDDPAEREAAKAAFPSPPTPDLVVGRAVLSRAIVHIHDYEAEPGLRRFSLTVKSSVAVPMLRGDVPIGALQMGSRERGGFSDAQVGLLQTFADQAVIAIAAARLFEETREALERQTATAEVLKVISRSAFELEPVLDALLSSACRLCEADFGTIRYRAGEGGDFRLAATFGCLPEWKDHFSKYSTKADRGSLFGRTIIEGRTIHLPDVLADPDFGRPEAQRLIGFRSTLSVPLAREGQAFGAINVFRFKIGPFESRQIELLETFADQAVIAIENTRLFHETKEALEQQTATSEVLEVISSSPGELAPVFQKMLENATRVCNANFGIMNLWDGEKFTLAADHNIPPAFAAYRQGTGVYPHPETALAKIIRTHQPAQIYDLMESPAYLAGVPMVVRIVEGAGARTLLVVPMLKEGELVGAMTIFRREVRPFTDKQVALVESFTKQAVIAIENTRLLRELRERTDDLGESLQQQTAMSEVLQIISSSPNDLTPVFDKMLENATRVCGAEFGSMVLVEDGVLRRGAVYNPPPALAAARADRTLKFHPESAMAVVLRDRRVVQIEDLRNHIGYLDRSPAAVELVEFGGARTIVVVPMLRDNEVIGAITVYRQEVRPFSDKQIDLLSNFARQAVIAIENARLLQELRQRTDDLSRSLHDLRSAQDRLVQTEKLASLGQLTAGIAHEIKNPLNFVNNFSALSVELTDELRDVLKQETLTDKGRGELDELTGLLQGNLSKVVQHGRRADSIVKNMLLHSRSGSSERRSADINKLVEESLNLAYHGARAEQPDFAITLKQDLDPAMGAVELYPQEMTRALLNLISNGFYAAARRKAENHDAAFEPVLSAVTKNLGEAVEIRIRDNGIGIPPEVREKMFNPFFTTKPTGEGTGLGLSMTHDIVVKQHGGRIDVETEPGTFTEFIITLPRGEGAAAQSKPE